MQSSCTCKRWCGLHTQVCWRVPFHQDDLSKCILGAIRHTRYPPQGKLACLSCHLSSTTSTSLRTFAIYDAWRVHRALHHQLPSLQLTAYNRDFLHETQSSAVFTRAWCTIWIYKRSPLSSPKSQMSNLCERFIKIFNTVLICTIDTWPSVCRNYCRWKTKTIRPRLRREKDSFKCW